MQAPAIYNFDAQSGAFLSAGKADPSPLENGVWLVPAHSTLIAPPSAAPDQLRWDGKKWQLDAETVSEPVNYRISKDAIWRRATDKEASLMEAALQAQPIRIRRIYDGATHLQTGDELFDLLQAAIIEMFGADRARELLAPG